MNEELRQQMEAAQHAPSRSEEEDARKEMAAFNEWVAIWGWPSADCPYPGSDWAQL